MQNQYYYQIFFNETSINSVMQFLTNLDFTYRVLIDKEEHDNYAEFYTDKVENLPEEDESFRYRIYDEFNEDYIKIEKFFYN